VVGAVDYHPHVREIWTAFAAWFRGRGLALEPCYFDTYDEQLQALLRGDLDTAWCTSLAYVQALQQTRGTAGALAMRDTDRGWRSLIVAPEVSGVRGLEDLRGLRIGFGDLDSPHGHIIPVHALRAAGFDPARDAHPSRLDRDVGMHGHSREAEPAQLARLRTGELDACVISSATALRSDLHALTCVWRSPPYHHCCFTVLDEQAPRHHAFRTLLLSMEAADPALHEPMQLHAVGRWLPFQPGGYWQLIDAMAAGPVVVGEARHRAIR
jgi:ABC-type phosphate/phosphonate transport system substrate-binding protein